jgi:hypothetical protein
MLMRLKILIELLFFFTVFLAAELHGQHMNRDAIVLKNGTTLVGTLLASQDDSIRIQTDEGTILVFHKKEVVARTKESVLPTYVPVEERKIPHLAVALTGGRGLNKLYGLGIGAWVGQTLVSGFFLGVNVSYYGGATREFSFDVTKLVSVNPLQYISVHADVSEKTSALMGFVVAGKDISWKWGTVFRPYGGIGMGKLRTELTYLNSQVPSGEDLEGSVPLEGNRILAFLTCGAQLVLEIAPGVLLQPELRYQFSLVDFGGKPSDQIREQTFVEGGNSGLSLLLSLGVQLN